MRGECVNRQGHYWSHTADFGILSTVFRETVRPGRPSQKPFPFVGQNERQAKIPYADDADWVAAGTGADEEMLSDASDVLALEDELKACDKRYRDYTAALNFVTEYHIDDRFPGLANLLLAESEMARRRYGELLENATRHRVNEPVYEVSVADAAEALGVSEQTVRNWDQNGCPFDPNYPGRFNAIIFYQWAQTFRSLQNFKREAKKRAVLLNKPA